MGRITLSWRIRISHSLPSNSMHLWDYHMLEPLSSSALPTALFCDFSWRRLISSCHSFTQPSLKSQTVRPFLIGSVLLLRGSENLVILALHAVDLLQISWQSLDSIYSPVVSNTMRLNQQYCIVWISQHSHKHKLKHMRLCSLKSDKDFFFIFFLHRLVTTVGPCQYDIQGLPGLI